VGKFSKIGSQEELFITIIKDENGNELDSWKVMKKDYPRVLRILNKKYGLGIYIIDKKNKKDKDLNWAI